MSKNLSSVKASPKTLEEEIQKQSIFHKLLTKPKQLDEWIIGLAQSKNIVIKDKHEFVKGFIGGYSVCERWVLGVVAQHETEHKEKCEGFAKVIARLVEERYEKAKAEAERNQETFCEKASPKTPKVICLVGSTKSQWKTKYREVLTNLTLKGYVVQTVVWFRDQLPNFEAYRPLLERIHYHKIRISDIVVLIDPQAQGKHTTQEMRFAKRIGKEVIVYESAEQVDLAIRKLKQ